MTRFLVAFIGLLLACLTVLPAAHGKAKLTHSISGCSDADRPSDEERRVQRKLERCAAKMPCRHQAVKALPRPLQRCYLRPWDEKKRDACLKKSRRLPFVEARAEKGRIHVTQRLRSYCNASDKISLRLKKHGKKLILQEIFRAKTVARCVCPFDIRAEIEGLKPGTYTLEILFDNRYAKEKEKLHETEVKVP